MRHFALRLIIALMTFSLGAFLAVHSYRRVIGCAPPPPPPPKTIAQPVAAAVAEDFDANSRTVETLPAHSPEVPPAVKKELDKKFPGWRFPKIDPEIGKYLTEFNGQDSHPEFVSGDFDGDGRADYAALIEHGTASLNANAVPVGVSQKLLVFLNRGNTFKFYSLDESSEYVALIKKGEKGYSYETDKNFIYQNDSIFTGYWEKGGSSFVFEKGKFRSITTSD